MNRAPFLGLIGATCVVSLASLSSEAPPSGLPDRDVSVLLLLGEWFGDAFFPLAERIESCGWRMSRVGVDSSYRGCYNKARDVVLHSDILIKDLKDFSPYDCLIIPSGPQFRKFRENEEVLRFVRQAYDAGLLIASFCTGNMAVTASGVYEVPEGTPRFPDTVTLVKERVLLGPRGGGPPPGDGYESAPVDALCDVIAEQLGVMCPGASPQVTPRTPSAGTAIIFGESGQPDHAEDAP